MKTHQIHLTEKNASIPSIDINPNLILAFGNRQFMEDNSSLKELADKFPNAILSGCTTSGEIVGTRVFDGSLSVTFLEFEKSTISHTAVNIGSGDNASREAGISIGNSMNVEDLKHVLIFSDGLQVNGTDLVQGMSQSLPPSVSVTGGLAGDGPDFAITHTVNPDGSMSSGNIIAIGLHSTELQVSFASKGGWDSFGVNRTVTKSKGNVLYEIDHKPALDLYKSFLGEQAQGLPASGLLFPLSMRDHEEGQPVVRTILGIDEAEQSMTFAGDIPEGSFVRLMKANSDRLIDGAEGAAELSQEKGIEKPEFALLVSCVGRKLVLKQLIEEEVEVVDETLHSPTITGFYSYGELAPFGKELACQLHNQTMTVTTFSEA